jgi:serine/threonine protein kinase/tetratricopeptide (TPR) repeat protein
MSGRLPRGEESDGLGPGRDSALLSRALRIDVACDRFEKHWRGGQRPAIEHYLAEVAEPERPALLRDLVALELELRRGSGEHVEQEEYHKRFPEIVGLIGPSLDVTSSAKIGRPRLSGSDCVRAEARMAGFAPAGYDILGELGRGGMGVVYRAHDRRRDEIVALKTLPRIDPAALLRFKREFRVLAGISHPNLVSLYELISDGQDWFFTMELVDGVDFLTHVRSGPGPAATGEPDQSEEPDPTTGEVGPCHGRSLPTGLSSSQLDRLRERFGQLAAGILALHEAGKFHRDIKPTNVLVTGQGRVVLLDFGLAAEWEPTGRHRSSEAHVLGTVAYMAPEQAAGLPTSPASDWYSIGVMLYVVLTGRLPFLGRPLGVLMDKQRLDPPAPRELVPDLPEDLAALCTDLLRRQPEARPSGRDVLRRLSGASERPEIATARPASTLQALPLIGRQRQLECLEAAFETMRRGRTVALYVSGRSGVGKSHLVQRFLDGLCEREDAVVLAGRCYEQESVPYKALDSVIDALSRYLKRLSRAEVQALLPRDVHLLARVFPVLRYAEAVATAPRRAPDVPDPQEVRRRGFAALRELLARLGDRRPLVLFIDDLQWGDADSAALLGELLRPPDPPVLLLLGSYRTEDAESSLLLRELLATRAEGGPALEHRELSLDPLTRPAAETLALTLLDRGDPAASQSAQTIARESGGNPFFISELVRYFQAADGQTEHPIPRGGASLGDVLWDRIQRLPERARRLLEILAVSGQPLGRTEACRAAGLGTDDRTALNVLRSGRLVRGMGPAERDEIVTYHDRIRETIVGHLAPAVLSQHHLSLAMALEASGRADPEVLAVHFRCAGHPEKARDYFAQAAAQAAETLAFDRAAKLYRSALELWPVGGPQARPLQIRLGDALANAGRGAAAAQEYLSATGGSMPAEMLKLRRRAAMQLLISGHFDQGLAILRDVLIAVGLGYPATPRRAFWSLLWNQIRLRLRGIDFRPRSADHVPEDQLRVIDILWTAVAGLSIIDPIRGADFQTRGLLLALEAGETSRVVRALALEAAHLSVDSGPDRRRAARLVQVADQIARREDAPHAIGMIALARGLMAYLEGSWKQSLEYCDQADGVFRNHCTGAAGHLNTVHSFALWALIRMGELAELNRRWPALIQEARERGNMYLESNIINYIMCIVNLSNDNPAAARDGSRPAPGQWSRQGFHFQHHNGLRGQVYIDLYQGDGEAAWRRVLKEWPAYKTSQLLRIQEIRVDALHMRSCSAVAAVASGADPGPLLRIAEGDARRLGREDVAWAQAHARFVRAGIARARGDLGGARANLEDATARYAAAGMHLCAAATRRRLGALLGGDAGRTVMAEADSWMQGQQIRNPKGMADLYAPGFPS